MLTQVSEASVAQLDEAIWAARAALGSWSALSPLERARCMKRIAALVRRDAQRLARIVVMEQGKPLTEALGEVGGAAEFFDYFAEFARRIQGEILPSDAAEEQIWIQRVPVGVVGAIIPWNYPSALVSRKVAPSMIAGNTLVLKPHELTPLSALEMARIFEEAEVPPGVVNVVCGAGETIGQAMSSSGGFNLLTMTGSVPTGKRIMRTAADHLTPLSLELGGKAPFIVMPDCDIDVAVRAAATSRYMNCGQVCICNERTLVHHQIYDDFLKRFVAFSRTLRLGNPMQISTDLGPKVSLEELEKVEHFVDEAVRSGAKIALGGGRPQVAPISGGYWYLPTVLTGVDPSMLIMQREIFGPVLPIMPFSDFDEALSISNASRYGLSAYLYTHHMPTIMKAVRQIESGELYVNRVGPESLQGFHLGYGDSGVGGDDGMHGLEAYLRKKTVYLNYGVGSPVALMPYRHASDPTRELESFG
jgi:lactaldehyde dehydrogenase/glycolaldehyde dehydrogenase